VSKKQEEISKKILDYLRKNPDAGDTLEGISGWWVQSEYIEQSVDEVASVLERLTEKGLVKKQVVKGGSPFYKVCKET
jgi:Fe2+ or Zn2+ uptake regulation protein